MSVAPSLYKVQVNHQHHDDSRHHHKTPLRIICKPQYVVRKLCPPYIQSSTIASSPVTAFMAYSQYQNHHCGKSPQIIILYHKKKTSFNLNKKTSACKPFVHVVNLSLFFAVDFSHFQRD